MPWTSKDAVKHTKKAQAPKAQRQWQKIANQLLASGKPEGQAIREANGVIAKQK